MLDEYGQKAEVENSSDDGDEEAKDVERRPSNWLGESLSGVC